MNKFCVQHQKENWCLKEGNVSKRSIYNKQKPIFSAEGTSSKNLSSRYSGIREANHDKPSFLNAWYELQWFLNSRITLAQALDAAVKQIYSLSALLLVGLALVLLSAQLAGLAVLLSCAATLPLPMGLQFMFGSFTLILATAFKIMY